MFCFTQKIDRKAHDQELLLHESANVKYSVREALHNVDLIPAKTNNFVFLIITYCTSSPPYDYYQQQQQSRNIVNPCYHKSVT